MVDRSFGDLLADLELWLMENAPATYASLRPGVTTHELPEYTKTVKVPLVQDLATLLQWHNGATPQASAFEIFPGFEFMGVERLARAWTIETETGGSWRDSWVPIGSNGCGSMLVVDHAASLHGFQIFLANPAMDGYVCDISSSLHDLIEQLLTSMYSRIDLFGASPRVTNNALEWISSGGKPLLYDRFYV